MRKPVIAGNWKMNQSLHRVSSYFTQLKEHLQAPWEEVTEKVDVMFSVPFTLLHACAQSLQGTGVRVAAQNVHWEPQGAFTGEVSIPMLEEAGIKTSLVGHSERRQFFGESNNSAALKVKACLVQGVTPVLCIGESLQERESGRTFTVLKEQLNPVLKSIKDPDLLILAYEPVWAIGTGVAASPEQAEEAHEFIRSTIGETLGSETAESTRILYGGSMKPANTPELMSKTNIDGGLVGGASLKPADFASMIKCAMKI